MPSQPSYNGQMMFPFPGMAAVPPLAANLPAPVTPQPGAEAGETGADAPVSDVFAALLGPAPAERPTDALRPDLLPRPTLTTGRPQLFLPLDAVDAQPMPAPQASDAESRDAKAAAGQAAMETPPTASDMPAQQAGSAPGLPSRIQPPEQAGFAQVAPALPPQDLTHEPIMRPQQPASRGPNPEARDPRSGLEPAAAPGSAQPAADPTTAGLRAAQASVAHGPQPDSTAAPATVERRAAHDGRFNKAMPAQSALFDRQSRYEGPIPVTDQATARVEPVEAVPGAPSEGLGVGPDTPAAPPADRTAAAADQAAHGLHMVLHPAKLPPKHMSMSGREDQPDIVPARRGPTIFRADAPVPPPPATSPVLAETVPAQPMDRVASSGDQPTATQDPLPPPAGAPPITEQATSPQLRSEQAVAVQSQPQQSRSFGEGPAAEPAALDPHPMASPRGADTARAPADVAVSTRSLEGLRELDVRLMQSELGRVDVRLSIPEKGRLEAVVASDNPAALDLLRREGAELARALAAAAPSSDGASLSFQSRSSDEQSGRRGPGRQRSTSATQVEETPAEWRPITPSGRFERIA